MLHYRLVVSHEYHYEWHEERYKDVEEQLIVSNMLKDADIGRQLQDQMKVQTGSHSICFIPLISLMEVWNHLNNSHSHCAQVLVCTLSMLCSTKLQGNLLNGRAIVRLMVDEASQVGLAQG